MKKDTKKVTFEIDESDHIMYSLFLQSNNKRINSYAKDVFIETIKKELEESPKYENIKALVS